MSDVRKLLSSSSIVFLGTIISGAFSYLFNVSSARLLGPVQFGELSAILSLFTVASVGSNAFSIMAMRYSGDTFFRGNYTGLTASISILFKQAVALALIIIVAMGLAVGPLASFFGITNQAAVFLGLVTILLSFLLSVGRSIAQGVQRFHIASISAIVEMVTRFGLLLLFSSLGWGVYGGLAAIIAGTLVAYIATLPTVLHLVRLSVKLPDEPGAHAVIQQSEILAYAWPSLVVSFFLNILLTADILLAKRFFDPEVAGQYSAISAMAKLVIYGLGPVTSVMFPMITERQSRGEKHYKMLFLSLAVTVALGLGALIVFSVAPTFFVTLLYGGKYAAAATFLPQATLIVLGYACINLFTNYYMAIKDTLFIWLLGAGSVLGMGILLVRHTSLAQLLAELSLIMAGLVLLMIIRYLLLKQAQVRAVLTGTYV